MVILRHWQRYIIHLDSIYMYVTEHRSMCRRPKPTVGLPALNFINVKTILEVLNSVIFKGVRTTRRDARPFCHSPINGPLYRTVRFELTTEGWSLCVHASLDRDHGQIHCANGVKPPFQSLLTSCIRVTFSIKARGVYPRVGEFRKCL